MDIERNTEANFFPDSVKEEKRAQEIDKWADFAGSLSASALGAVAFAATRRCGFTPISKMSAAACSGMLARPTAKSAVEHMFVAPRYHTTTAVDCAWGAIDGLSGIFGAAAEAKVSSALAKTIGSAHLKREVPATLAEQAGQRLIDNSIGYRFAANYVRGITGGLAGSLAFSLPHRIFENRTEIETKPLNGLNKACREVALDTASGSLLCAGASTIFSTFTGRTEIVAKTLAALKGKTDLAELRILHFNDLHSNLLKNHSLARLGGAVDAIRQSETRPLHLYSLGDEYSGNVISNFTENGKLENEAIAMLEPTAIIPGNHAADRSGGEASIEDWVKIIEKQATTENGKLTSKALAANIEITLPGYQSFASEEGIVRPYRIVEIESPRGSQKIGLLGLITKELADATKDVIVADPIARARQNISELNADGVNKVVVLSHLGMAADTDLAKSVEGISAIVGAHSHDATPLPLWVTNETSGRPVPIVQAGSEGKWLGDLELVFNADGSANRLYTKGTLHPITKELKEHERIKTLIENSSMAQEVRRLEESSHYSQRTLAQALPFGNIRRAEDLLGNVVSDAQLEGINEHLAQMGQTPAVAFLKHSGDIRKGLSANEKLDGLALGNVFCNGDNTSELCLVNMTGEQIKAVLEFGVSDLHQLDPSGNFLQVSRLRYKFDLDKPVGQRVSNILIWNAQASKFEGLTGEQIYKVGTLLHPIDKWGKNGVFKELPQYQELLQSLCKGEPPTARQAKTAAHQLLQSKAVGLSQPRLLDKFLSDPRNIERSLKNTPRIEDTTIQAWRPSCSAMASSCLAEQNQ